MHNAIIEKSESHLFDNKFKGTLEEEIEMGFLGHNWTINLKTIVTINYEWIKNYNEFLGKF